MQLFDKAVVRQQLKKYLELGLSPIPLQGKVANYHWKVFNLTESNMEQFIKPGVNWGIRAGLLPSEDYLWFIDLDSKELLGSFYELHPALMSAPLVSTSKGWHIWLTWKEQPRTRHLAGIDIIANGYVCCPPSVHSNGHEYKFIIPLRGLPPSYKPEWLSTGNLLPLIVINPPEESARRPRGGTQRHYNNQPPGVPQGQRHTVLISYLGFLHKTLFTEEEALARALAWNKKCSPPEVEQVVISTVRSCWQKWDVFEG